MPELAEVETVRRQLHKQLVGKKIKTVALDPKDRWLFAFVSPQEVTRSLIGRKILGTGRRGKYFWLELDRKPWPLFHLGMSGNVSVLTNEKKSKHQKVWGGQVLYKDSGDDRHLWFARLLLEMTDKTEMALIDPRRFGRMWLTEDPLSHPRIKVLGPDPLIDFPKAKELAQTLSSKRRAIKAVLLDQSLFAGIGNWLADEILFQSRINPHTLASQLSALQIRALHKQCLAVVKKAVATDADYERFPKTWLFHQRWGKKKSARSSKGSIRHETIGGRTTAWVPHWQK